jgi:hypothetical protein
VRWRDEIVIFRAIVEQIVDFGHEIVGIEAEAVFQVGMIVSHFSFALSLRHFQAIRECLSSSIHFSSSSRLFNYPLYECTKVALLIKKQAANYKIVVAADTAREQQKLFSNGFVSIIINHDHDELVTDTPICFLACLCP